MFGKDASTPLLPFLFIFPPPDCQRYYFLHKGECLDDCPNGYFANERQQECVRCHSDCASCDGPGFDDCNVCRNLKAVRYNGECLSHCPNNTYYDKTTNECRGTEGGSFIVISMYKTKSNLKNLTINELPSPFSQSVTGHVWPAQAMNRHPASLVILTGVKMPADIVCGSISALCSHTWTRMGSANSVTKPAAAVLGQIRTTAWAVMSHTSFWVSYRIRFWKWDTIILRIIIMYLCPSDNTCVLKCPVGYYAENVDERACERCHFSCQSCTGRHSLQCVACKQGYFRQGMSCVEFCSNGSGKLSEAQSPFPHTHAASK